MSADAKFMWAIQSLASPYDVQVKLFPDFAEVPDELILELDDAGKSFLDNENDYAVTHLQRQKVEDLNQYIQEMSDRDDPSLWTMEALQTSEEWRSLRDKAKEVIAVMG